MSTQSTYFRWLMLFPVLLVAGLLLFVRGTEGGTANDLMRKRLDEIRLFTLPPAGIDHLTFEVNDTIEVPGIGEDTVKMVGTYTIQRSEPTYRDWEEGTIEVKMLDLNVRGRSPLFGEVAATINSKKETKGKVGPAKGPGKPKPCQFASFIRLKFGDRGMDVFNKEPVPLWHMITHVPPIGQGGGTPEPVRIALYSVDDPDGKPLAYLKKVKTEIGPWVETVSGGISGGGK